MIDKTSIIEETYNKAREDGSYSLLFGDIKIGKLISATQSATIRMGNQLEKLIMERAKIIDENTINKFFEKALTDGIYIIPKNIIAKNKRLNFDQKPDMILVLTLKNTCIVIELKLGDNFDTKKAQAEVDNLKKYSEKLDRATTYKIHYAVCMFFAKDKEAVVKGFKNKITIKEVLTGKEFCEIANIDYNEIHSRLKDKQSSNRAFFIKKILEVSSQSFHQ